MLRQIIELLIKMAGYEDTDTDFYDFLLGFFKIFVEVQETENQYKSKLEPYFIDWSEHKGDTVRLSKIIEACILYCGKKVPTSEEYREQTLRIVLENSCLTYYELFDVTYLVLRISYYDSFSENSAIEVFYMIRKLYNFDFNVKDDREIKILMPMSVYSRVKWCKEQKFVSFEFVEMFESMNICPIKSSSKT